MNISISSAEQLPYGFRDLHKPDIEFTATTEYLKTGDYQVSRPPHESLKDIAVIERKSLADACGTFGRGRDRFVRELERMRVYGYAAIVIEAELSSMSRPADHLVHSTKMNPRSIIGSLLAWSIRYNVHVWCCPGRAAAERVTFRLLRAWFSEPTKQKE